MSKNKKKENREDDVDQEVDDSDEANLFTNEAGQLAGEDKEDNA